MCRLVSVLVAAAVFAGCSGPASTAKPSTQAPATVAPASPTAAVPTDTAVRHFPDGSIPAGTYSFLNGIGTFDVPSGWEGCCDGFAVLKSDFAAMAFENITEVVVYADSCHWQAGPNPEPKDAKEAAAAFSAQKGHQGTPAEQVTVAGLAGWHVRLTVPADQPTTGSSDDLQFTGCDNGQFASWGIKPGDGLPSRFQQGPSQIDDLYIVDVGDQTVVLDVVSDPKIAASTKAELDAMLASVKFN